MTSLSKLQNMFRIYSKRHILVRNVLIRNKVDCHFNILIKHIVENKVYLAIMAKVPMTFDSIMKAMNSIHGTKEDGEQEIEPIGRVLAAAIGDLPENYNLFAQDLSVLCGHEFTTNVADEYEGEEIG